MFKALGLFTIEAVRETGTEEGMRRREGKEREAYLEVQVQEWKTIPIFWTKEMGLGLRGFEGLTTSFSMFF